MQGCASRRQRQCAINDQDPDHVHRHGSSMTNFRLRTHGLSFVLLKLVGEWASQNTVSVDRLG
jgi:hypothetical protein